MSNVGPLIREIQQEAFEEITELLTAREMGMVLLNGDLSLYSLPSTKRMNNSVIKTEGGGGEGRGQRSKSGSRSGSRTYSLDLSSGAPRTMSEASSSSSSSSSKTRKNAVTPTSDQWQNSSLSLSQRQEQGGQDGQEQRHKEGVRVGANSKSKEKQQQQRQIIVETGTTAPGGVGEIIAMESSVFNGLNAANQAAEQLQQQQQPKIYVKVKGGGATTTASTGSCASNVSTKNARQRSRSSSATSAGADDNTASGTSKRGSGAIAAEATSTLETKYELAHPSYQAPVGAQNGVPFYGSAGGSRSAATINLTSSINSQGIADITREGKELSFPVRDRSASIGGSNGSMDFGTSAIGLMRSSSGDCSGINHSRSNSLEDVRQVDETYAKLIRADLIATLNNHFPDYDFNNTNLNAFIVADPSQAIVKVGNYLSELTKSDPQWLSSVWSTINSEIKLSNCNAYSYVPDMEGDPFSDTGSVWSFNYFFVDADARKVALFTCIASQKQKNVVDGNGDINGDNDTDYRSTDDDSMAGSSPRSNIDSPSPYGYGNNGSTCGSGSTSPAHRSTLGNSNSHINSDYEAPSDEDGGRKYPSYLNIAVQDGDESDSSCDDMR